MVEDFAKLNLNETPENNPDDTLSNCGDQDDDQEAVTEDTWKWWEKKLPNDGTHWASLKHNGPAFPPPYKPLRFFYERKPVFLSDDAEEMAVLYAQHLDHAYTTDILKNKFNCSFFKDWRNVMTAKERNLITDFLKCDFSNMHAFYQNMSPDKGIKAEKDKYGYCVVDGRKERISGFSIQSPDLVRRNESMLGMLRKRVRPEDVTINCTLDKKPPPPPGHKWKEVIQNNKVKWLATWKDSRGKSVYMQFHRNSGINGKDDYQKYETARKLHTRIESIRDAYKADWAEENSKLVRQRAVALYIIDQLALRVGIESDDDNVGCCSLLTSHITLIEPNTVVFTFTGKKSIKYNNEVTVEPLAFKNLTQFMEDGKKRQGNQKRACKLFDNLSTHTWNTYLKAMMPGLTGKVFRTYHASKTFEEKLKQFTDYDAPLEEKLKSYKNANVKVANLCNHKRTVLSPFKEKPQEETKIEIPGTNMSKEFYNDPRITAAWCHKHNIPYNTKGIFNKSLCEKFNWAIAMVEANPDFEFIPTQEALQ